MTTNLPEPTVETALKYYDLGFMPIPCKPSSKEPAIQWTPYKYSRAERQEVEALFTYFTDANIALMCGIGGLVVLDCDTEDAFAVVCGKIADEEIATWVVKTSRGGHIYLRTDQKVRTQKAGAIDVRSYGGYVIAPPSLHPSGVRYQFLCGGPESDIAIAQIEWDFLDYLGVKPLVEPSTEVAAEAAPRVRLRPLSPRARRLLRGDPAAIAKYRSKSDADAALCLACFNAGRTKSEIAQMFRESPTSGKYLAEGKNGEHYIRYTIEKVFGHFQSNPPQAPTGNRVDLEQWWDFLIRYPWHGKTGSTDQAVFRSLLKIADRIGALEFGASCREVADLAMLSKKAAWNALRRLSDRGFIRQTEPALNGARVPATFELADVAVLGELLDRARAEGGARVREGDTLLTEEYVRECLLLEREDDPHDVYVRGALGLTGQAVHRVLRVSARLGLQRHVREIELLTGCARSTVIVKLRRMWSYGLAKPLGDGFWEASTSTSMDEAAQGMQVLGKLEARRSKHEAERVRYDDMRQRIRAHASESVDALMIVDGLTNVAHVDTMPPSDEDSASEARVA